MKTAETKFNVLQMVQMAMLAAIAIVLVAFVRIPLVPSMEFLKYDMADAPILIATLLFGTIPGLTVLVIVSVIQAFFFGGDGWTGLFMHVVASGALVVLTGFFYRYKKSFKGAIIGMALGTIAMTLLMIPMNYIVTVNIYGTPKEVVDAMMLPGIIPFNLLKAALNSVIAGVLYKALQPFFRKNKSIIHSA